MAASQPIIGVTKTHHNGRLSKIGARILLCLVIIFINSCTCSLEKSFPDYQTILNHKFDATLMRQELNYIASAPHPFGSQNQKNISTWLKQKIDDIPLESKIEIFEAKTPNPVVFFNSNAPAERSLSVKGLNVTANLPGTKDCRILIGSHYDTKELFTHKNLGANDSGSSSVALLHLIRYFENNRAKRCHLTFIWFDGEESVLPDWNDGQKNYPTPMVDNTYGSRHFAQKLKRCHNEGYCLPSDNNKIVAVVILDMIGSRNLSITQDTNSTPKLISYLKESALKLNLESKLSSQRARIEDDHIPFKKLGINVLNIIDFNNLEHWHTHSDTPDNVSVEEMIHASRLALYVVEKISLEN